MKKTKSIKDPYGEREAEKYVRPIASRELIMQVLFERGEPLAWQQLADVLGLNEEDDLQALQRRLRAMERDAQLIRNRRRAYGLVEKMDLLTGYVLAHPDGFGFLVSDDGGDDLFLSARQMRQLMHRDRVVACVSGIDRRGRREAAIVEILERHTHQVVGRFICDQGIGFVSPDNKRITHDILVPPQHQREAKDGQIVVVELIEQPTKRHQPIGRIIELLGEHMAPGMEIDVAIRAHELPFSWSKSVEQAIRRFKKTVPDSAARDREDIRHLPLVTIDGADAKDFDDAVYCEAADKRGWRLFVAIADVAYYVRPGSALDQEAIDRGTSVYFPGRVIPMLPEVLSNGLCSIKPDEDRFCVVCEMLVSHSGVVKSKRFFNGVMHSHARLVYDDVAALLSGDKRLRKKHQTLLPHLENLYRLYEAFSSQRKKRGAIDFETIETVIEFGQGKKIERIVPLVRNDAHKMIEEFMIAANVCAAEYLAEHALPVLYRVHDIPKERKVADLRSFLGELGLRLGGVEKPQAKHFAKLLSDIQQRPDLHLIQTVMLRSLNQAMYSPDNVGHFGLALEEYAHFTSPIRRYPDLLVHRAIKHVLAKKPLKSFKYSIAAMQGLGEVCSMKERRADDATRDVVDWLKCEYMMDKVGDVFDGIITTATSFGIFVELKEIYVEGLVHVASLKNDYYHFDPLKHCLRGERTHQSYRLADEVRVRVVRVDLDTKKIDFELVADKGPVKSKPHKKKVRSRPAKKTGRKKMTKCQQTT